MSKGETVRKALKGIEEDWIALADNTAPIFKDKNAEAQIKSMAIAINNLYIAVKGLAEIEGVV